MKKLIFLILLFVLSQLLVISPALSQEKNTPAKVMTQSEDIFNVDAANKSFDAITIKLSTQNLEYSSLKQSIETLEDLNQQGKDCAEKSEEQFKAADDLLKEPSTVNLTEQQQSEYVRYIQTKKALYTKQIAECKLFAVRSNEVLLALKKSLQKLSAQNILKRSSPIWAVFTKQTTSQIVFDKEKLLQQSGYDKLDSSVLVTILTLLLVFGGGALYVRKKCLLWLAHHHEIYTVNSAWIATIQAYIIPLSILSVISIVFLELFHTITPEPLLLTLSLYSLNLCAGLMLLAFLLAPPHLEHRSPLHIPRDLGKSFYKRTSLLFIVFYLGIVTKQLFSGQVIESFVADVARTLFITVLSITLIWICWQFSDFAKLAKFNNSLIVSLKIYLSILLISIISIEWFGYHELAIYFVSAIFFSLLIWGFFWGLYLLFYNLVLAFNHLDYSFSRKVRTILGVKPHKTLQELAVIKIAVILVLIGSLLVSLLYVWKVPPTVIDRVVDSMTTQTKLLGITIKPLQIVYGLLMFAVINLLGRWVTASIARKYQDRPAVEGQVAIASITGYISFSIAILIGLLVAGVDFTGLAIIAGALSVGIGLGLQNIVNNFIAGIILLLEKSILPGDRIIIGKTEGFVKKVRVRSTHIVTLTRENVIVPNSELIGNQVTNYMFRDRTWILQTQVVVAYGSDVDLVKQTLLEVAAQHPDVLTTSPNEPVVIFREFSANNLRFELWCVISDINKKYLVASDINFAINKAFRASNIIIA